MLRIAGNSIPWSRQVYPQDYMILAIGQLFSLKAASRRAKISA